MITEQNQTNHQPNTLDHSNMVEKVFKIISLLQTHDYLKMIPFASLVTNVILQLQAFCTDK